MISSDARSIAAQIAATVDALPERKTATVRGVRRDYSKTLKDADPELILALAKALIEKHDLRWVAYELIRYHPSTFRQLDGTELEALGQGIDSWHAVDEFARTLAGPAWVKGQVSDARIHEWARSEDLWWRRAALVSTVAWNMRSHGGTGDVDRTLAVCRLLVSDHEDMVVKALSWALRELIPHDAEAVREFLAEYEEELAARVKREVNNKLTTGLKIPKRSSEE